MAKQKRHKAKTGAAGYVEKISSQIFDRIKEELEKSFRVTPSDKIKKIKKMLPGLRKQVKKKIKEEFEKSFRVMPSDKIKKIKKMLPGLRKQVKKKIKEELEKSFRLIPSGKIKRGKKTKTKGKRGKVKK
jgi:DNA anti-recombination protein RmuC